MLYPNEYAKFAWHELAPPFGDPGAPRDRLMRRRTRPRELSTAMTEPHEVSALRPPVIGAPIEAPAPPAVAAWRWEHMPAIGGSEDAP